MGTVALNEKCSARIQRKLPQKLKDLGSFSIPYIIGDSNCERALCDLGASINLMPFSLFRRLNLGEVKPTSISLQLADRSIKYPRGIVEDVLVKVDKLIFLADYVCARYGRGQGDPSYFGKTILGHQESSY